MASDIIFRNILESMSDGVMTIGLDGKILTFNAAAESILKLKSDDVLGESFAEVFLVQEENDQFNQTILNAVYDADTIHNKIVLWHSGEVVLTLEVTTSFLSAEENGEKKNIAVIVVFTDKTEVERLQDSEQRLTEELKEKHKELQASYLEMEEANTSLKSALKKVQIIRVAATVFVIVLFLGIGFITWKQTGPVSAKSVQESPGKGGSQERVYAVALQSLTDSITMKGVLKPIQIVNITSPFSGMVKEKYFEYGQAITKGQILFKIDRAETEVKYREAKTAYIEAYEKLKEMENWNNSNDMAKAQQSVLRSKMTLEGHHKTFQETERLFKKEIVPATEYANAKQQYATAKMDYETALREAQIVKEKGEGQNRYIAKLKLENARQKLQDIENQLRHADVVAPVSGTILLPDQAGDKKGKMADRGVTFSLGDILLSIGNTEGLSMTAEVDELEVLKIKKDQEVRITGEAFGEPLKGQVAHISSQAVKSEGGKKTAGFEVTVSIDKVPETLRGKLRLGMSAHMEIMVMNKPNVIMVPIAAVRMEGKDRVVTVKDKKSQTIKSVPVETGITTPESVEITKGLSVGDEVTY